MMEKSAQPVVRVGGSRPPPFTLSTIAYKVVVYASAERADHSCTLMLIYPYIYSVGGMTSSCNPLPAHATVLLFED
jgi:hypothetical protein